MPYTLVGSLEKTPLAVKILENRLYIYVNKQKGRKDILNMETTVNTIF